jgi:hypothetical protein
MSIEPEVVSDVQAIKQKLESIEYMFTQNLKANEKLERQILDLFKKRPKMAELFVAIEGNTRSDLEGYFPKGTIARYINILKKQGLIEVIGYKGSEEILKKTLIDKVYNLSHRLKAMHKFQQR